MFICGGVATIHKGFGHFEEAGGWDVSYDDDFAYFQTRGFTFPFSKHPITGHIDFLQLRSGFLHVLDYKPEAAKEKHAATQLTIYAMALSRRTGLPIKAFKCAWFDDKDYFEFFPLPAIYPKPA